MHVFFFDLHCLLNGLFVECTWLLNILMMKVTFHFWSVYARFFECLFLLNSFFVIVKLIAFRNPDLEQIVTWVGVNFDQSGEAKYISRMMLFLLNSYYLPFNF